MNGVPSFPIRPQRYRTGLGTIFELTDAQNTLTTAQADHVRALLAYHVAAAALERATATSLE